MKINKVKFLDASECQQLTKEEQKVILGGYDGPECCWWESKTDRGCFNNATSAEFMGTYHWECNTSFAKAKCNC